ncbi:phage tail protein [Reichenbachiella carrageenanivorans]|uniref:Phage tail protein n=1 Tax=Reichenbachiella carrageenanivorans TaxID=2979869 RepID=A0ABY6CUZ5_9BACT|nr:phage tail protein [Reichenbachiella carrageenanivorans]UXX77731.1 phage tail protein [Reichenbachiella carrageenanivorans]
MKKTSMAANNEYPLTGYRFVINFEGAKTLGNKATDGSDASFQEISGISAEIPVEEIQEGGENRFVHRLPQPIRYSNLILKRGLTQKTSELTNWCKTTMEGGLRKPIELKQVVVQLLDEENKPVLGWSFLNAYPVKWEYSALEASKGDIFIQTVELSHQGFVELDM